MASHLAGLSGAAAALVASALAVAAYDLHTHALRRQLEGMPRSGPSSGAPGSSEGSSGAAGRLTQEAEAKVADATRALGRAAAMLQAVGS